MKFPFVHPILAAAGFIPYMGWSDYELVLEREGRFLYVDTKQGVISVTDTTTNTRLVTTYFSDLESFCTEMAAAYVWYNR